MGLNCAVAVLTGVDVADLARLGVHPTGRVVTGDVALGEEQPCAVLRDGRLVLVCADPRLLDVADEAAATTGAPLAGVALGSTADVYVLRFRDGARARERVLYGAETVSEGGEAWVEEEALGSEAFAEDGVLAVLERATGLRLDDDWMHLELQELAWTLPGDEDAPATDPVEPAHASGIDALMGAPSAVTHPGGHLVDHDDLDDRDDQDDHGAPAGARQADDPAARYVDLAPVAASSRVTAAAVGVGLAIEALLALLALTTDLTFGTLLPHVLFVAVACFVLAAGRLNLIALVVLTLEAVVVLVTVLGAANRDEAPVALLLGVGAYLVALIGVLGWHARRVFHAQHAMHLAAQ
ncbi:hypothetical protein JK386_09805 [Nocardioides sp. zg-536]|uniref:Uncharacterized protein n=1 Tax=Nocardioides faecalis TaxID=2803858 RepID=A0A939BYC2_9ACTN|nr:hypothetical protein [Nocardioides faecalis]MBM9460198.1 hypothetical protein [Nocardioides faecalis]MBS4754680.1 hypothetical protein [Nocardioides faecalis]QVI60010.1 hypothetical protein KG111_06800 [Nocardioides faecalis]